MQIAGSAQPVVRRVASSTTMIAPVPKTMSSVVGCAARRTSSSLVTTA